VKRPSSFRGEMGGSGMMGLKTHIVSQPTVLKLDCQGPWARGATPTVGSWLFPNCQPRGADTHSPL